MSQLFEDGTVVNVNGTELECVAVSYQETDGERHTFGYAFRPKADLDVEREAAAKAEEARLALENGEAPVAPTEPVEQPEVNKEETLNVK